MKILIGIIQHIFIVSILLTILIQNFLRLKFSAESSLIDRIITNSTINLALFTASNYLLSFVGVKTKYIYITMITLIGILITINFLRTFQFLFREGLSSKFILMLSIFIPAICISIWEYLPTLTLLNSMASSLNMTSIGNNDIANYALTAREYLQTGFTNSERYPDVDFNSYSRDLQHLTVHLLISFTSFISNLAVWKIMNSVMIFTIALNTLVLIKLFRIISKNTKFVLSITTVSIALLNPLNSYVIHHYFLSQSLSLFILVLIIIKSYEIYTKNSLNLIDRIEITSLVILSIFSYPSILLPAIFGVLVINLINEKILKKQSLNTIFKKYRDVFIFGVLGFVISLAYIPRALNILFLHATIKSGWNLPAPNVIGILFSPFYISNGINEIISKLLWLGVLALVIGVIIINFKSSKVDKYFLLLFSSINIVYIAQVLIRGEGFGHYQNWKFLSYIFPLIIIFVIAELSKLNIKLSFLLIPFLIAGLLAPWSLWKDGNKFGTSSIVSKDLVDLQIIKSKYSIDSLNAMIDPFYQTMAVGLVTDINRIYFSSPTYYPLNSNDDSCSLVKNSDDRYSNKVRINESFSLISSKNLRCDVVKHNEIFKLRENTAYRFDNINLENRNILDRGWSYAESWGTWSEGDYSRIRFNLEEGIGTAGTLRIKSTFFAPNRDEIPQMQIILNGESLGSIFVIENKNTLEFEVKNLKLQDNILEFLYSNITSPKKLNISEDDRMIFYGISSFELIKSS